MPVKGSTIGRIHESPSRDVAWYAVVDAARDSTFLHLPDGATIRRESLYAGELGAMLDDVAPHLVAFAPESRFADWFRCQAAAHCGILIRSNASFSDLRKHLRQFLMVKDTAGKQYRFRFYDPRVLRAFLPSCAPAEATRFFGPVRQFRAPGSGGTADADFMLEREQSEVSV
jgi:hypothetical protein